MSRSTANPTKCQVRPAKTQVTQGIRPVWLESLCAVCVAKDTVFLHFLHADSEDRFEILLGAHSQFVGFVILRLINKLQTHVRTATRCKGKAVFRFTKKGKQKSPGRATSRSCSQSLIPGGRETVTQINVCIVNRQNMYEPQHGKTNNMACAPSEDSDQSGHPPSLIRVFVVRIKKHWVLSHPLSAQQRLWSDWADAQADLSLRWAHSHFVGFVMRWHISFVCCAANNKLQTHVNTVTRCKGKADRFLQGDFRRMKSDK